MRKFYMILGAALMMSSAMFAQHTIDEYKFIASDVAIEKAGGLGDLEVSLESPEVLASANFFISLPEGITVGYDPDLEDDMIALNEEMCIVKGKKAHTVQYGNAASGYMIAIYNTYLDEDINFKQASGKLVTVTLQAAEDLDNGEYEGKLVNCDMDNFTADLMKKNGWSSKVFPDVPFTIKVGTGTGINEIEAAEDGWDGAAVYDLNGRKINGKPAQKGVYIKNGKKVVVK
jgi:hypothetical protein